MKTLRRLMLRGPAPWLEKERARMNRKAGRDSNRIRHVLKECGVALSASTDGIPTDLGDMLQVFRDLKLSMDWLVSKRRKPTRNFARAILEQIRNDIYIHLDYHLNELRRPLDVLIEELEEEDSRGATSGRGRSARGKGKRKRESFQDILAWSAKKH